MKKGSIVIASLVALSGLALVRSFYELRHLKAAGYKLNSDKLEKGKKHKIVFLSDLHGMSYGKNNRKLLSLIKKQDPDMILIGGDMVTASLNASDEVSLPFLRELPRIAPTYYAMGNHEEYMRRAGRKFGGRYKTLKKTLKRAGIVMLDNSHADIGGNISIYGLSLPLSKYRKLRKHSLTETEIEELIGVPDKGRYNILLAHSPEFSESYEEWKPDLVLSGHYHGGVVRLPKIGGVISPNFRLFPRYSVGRFKKNDTDIIVSAGCGSHKINIRLFNRPEVVVIELSS